MYSYDLTNCFEDKIGKTGLSKSEYSQTLQDSITIIDEMRSDYESGKFPILNITNKKSDLEEINSTANYLRSNFDMLVVIGTGGSTLNPQIFAGFSDNAEKVIFIDHTDSQLTKRTLEKLDLKRTAFLSISKSGGTIETIAQTLICLGFVKKNYPKNYNKNFFFIIEPKKSYLRDLATSINSIILEHDTQIGGRFSGLTNVGLLVASYLGFDIEKIRQGAKNAIENDFFNYDVSNASKSAVLMFCLMQKNISTTVMMPYLASFKNFGVWYQQIWAESLGKVAWNRAGASWDHRNHRPGLPEHPGLGSTDRYRLRRLGSHLLLVNLVSALPTVALAVQVSTSRVTRPASPGISGASIPGAAGGAWLGSP